MPKVAVILSGCGVYDGAEIHESVATLLALHRAGAETVVAAPDIPQMHVVNHQTGQPAAGESRNVRVEAARIARGPVADVADLAAADFDAVILPGGFGAAKNLCTFAVDGADCRVDPGVADFLRAMNAAGKVIGALCIAPALLARVFGADGGVQVTIGTDPATAAAVEAMGAQHVAQPSTGVLTDAQRRIVTTPAYMNSDSMGDVFDGAAKLVARVLELAG